MYNTPSTLAPAVPCCVPGKCACHPTTGIGEPVDRQAGLIVALECTRVLNVVDQARLEFAVSRLENVPVIQPLELVNQWTGRLALS